MSTARRKQQAQEADELIRQRAQQEQQAAQQTAEDASGSETDDQATGEVSEQAVNDQGAAQTSQSDGSDGGDEDATRSAQDDDAYWKHKYKSLDGIVRQRDQRIEQLGDIIANMQQSIAAMQNQAPANQAPATPEPAVSKEDVDTFGPDLIDLIRRVFKDEAKSLEAHLKQQFSGFESKMAKVESSVKESAQEKFESYLDKNAPGWRQVDSDPEFLEWIKASKVRHQQLAMSVQSMDAVAAAELFNMYTQMHKQVQAEQAAPRENKQRELEKQLAPGKSRQVGQDHRQAGDKKQWTSSEIARAYAQRKSYSKQDWARQEREIAQAQAEGRVDYSR